MPPASPYAAAARNLVRFCRHTDEATLHASFAADFAFRDAASRFSVMKSPHTLPGPDQCHAWFDIDGRLLFDQLLGLELTYPGQPTSAAKPRALYTSHNYYRSHIDEYFCHTGGHPQPPVEGWCHIHFCATDRLRVTYTLENRADVPVPLRMRWVSRVAADLDASLSLDPDRVARVQARQKVLIPYTVDVRVAVDLPELDFSTAANGFATNHISPVLAPRASWQVQFTVAVDYTDSAALRIGSHVPPADEADLPTVIAEHESAWRRLPALPASALPYRRLVTTAFGILRSLRNRDLSPGGVPVTTIHAGKCGVAATWYWDSAFGILGLGLIGERDAVHGACHLLLSTLAPDGEPITRVHRGTALNGVQQPALAWSLGHYLRLQPDPELLAAVYEPLGRTVRWWLAAADSTPSGLVTYPRGGVCWDDSLRWQDRPVVYTPGTPWHDQEWGTMRADHFENVDTNVHLYLECRSLAAFARTLRRPAAEADAWDARAEHLATQINAHLLDPVTGCYSDRDRRTGTLTGMLSPGSFMPLYAGIAPPEQARAFARDYLLNPDHFYTVLPFPTLDRAHPAFRAGGHVHPVPRFPGALVQHAYWIGRTWPHQSFLMVGALHHAGLHAEAAAAADHILDALARHESIHECYDSLTGYPNGHPEFLWSAAAVLGLSFRLHEAAPYPTAPLPGCAPPPKPTANTK